MKSKTDFRIHRRDVLLHPRLMNLFLSIRDTADADELEIEFCDTLNRITSITFEEDKMIMQFDLSVASSVCLFHFALRDGYLNDFIEHLFYLICSEQSFIYGRYSISKYFSELLEASYKKIDRQFFSHRQSSDWELIMIIHIFIYTHEITHYIYNKNPEYKTTSNNLLTKLRRDAEKYLTGEGAGKDIASNCINAPNMGEELVCDYRAAEVAKLLSKNLPINVNTKLITEILEAQALISYLKIFSELIIFGGQIQKVNPYEFFQMKLRTFFSQTYISIFSSVYRESKIENDRIGIDIRRIDDTFSTLINSLLEQHKTVIASLYVDDISLPKAPKKHITREAKEHILKILKKHVVLFTIDGKEYDLFGTKLD